MRLQCRVPDRRVVLALDQTPPPVGPRRWNQIDTTSGPRMTPAESAQRQPGTLDRAVGFDRRQRIGGTRRVITAGFTIQRTDDQSVCLEDPHQQVFHRRPRSTACPSAASRSRASAAEAALPASARARITTRDPSGTRSSRSRMRCRNRRRTAFRLVALPIVRPTTKPARVGRPVSDPSLPATRCTTSNRPAPRTPRRAAT
jgi:hypothetical protein